MSLWPHGLRRKAGPRAAIRAVAIAATAWGVAGCSTPTEPGNVARAYAQLQADSPRVVNRRTVRIVHRDVTTGLETTYRVLDPKSPRDIAAAGLVICKEIDPAYRAALAVDIDDPFPTAGPRYYISCG